MTKKPEPDEDIEIAVEPDAEAAEIEVVRPEPEVIPPKAIEPEEGIQALKDQLETERRGRLEAEQRERTATGEVHKARADVADTNLSLVTNAIETVTKDNEILKANYIAAMTDGDHAAAFDAQNAMAQNAAKLQTLEQGKVSLEAAAKNPAPVERATANPVEAFAAQLSPRSAAWVRAHPEFATDPRLNQKMIGAHNMVVADGFAPDSDDYFAKVEGMLGLGRREVEEPVLSSAAEATGRRAAPPAAPVTRTGGGPGQNPNRVTLSAAEREIAAMNGMSDTEYAKQKLALQREGRMN